MNLNMNTNCNYLCTRNAIQMQYCIFEPLGGKLSVFRLCETQLSSTKQEIGLDVDTVVPHYDSKLNYDVKVSQTIVLLLKVDSSKFEKVLSLSQKWAQKRNRPNNTRSNCRCLQATNMAAQ